MKQSPKARKKAQQKRLALAQIPPPKDGRCEECHNKPDWRGLQKHHKVFRSHQGADTRDNIIFLCGVCHSLAHGIVER